jgi:hypothetical protein
MMLNQFWKNPYYNISPSQTQASLNAQFPEDPTFDNCKEWLMLFQYSTVGDSIVMEQLGDSLMVHYQHTPVTHYLMSYRQPLYNEDTIPKPIYERYFTTPQTVHDTFYAGFTQTQWRKKGGEWYEFRPPFYCHDWYPFPPQYCADSAENVAVQRKVTEDSPDSWWEICHDHLGARYFIFPILTPEPEPVIDTTVTPDGDTTYFGGDTVAMGDTLVVTDTIVIGGDTIVTSDTILTVREHDMLWKLTVVSPNPARGVAKVVASPGLSRVEAFNAAGTKLLDTPATGFSLSIDVGSWPSGTYLLRIHTPVGVTVKKLLVNGR